MILGFYLCDGQESNVALGSDSVFLVKWTASRTGLGASYLICHELSAAGSPVPPWRMAMGMIAIAGDGGGFQARRHSQHDSLGWDVVEYYQYRDH
jgi:hypothetical protein